MDQFSTEKLTISINRLLRRLYELAEIGAHKDGGTTRISLTDDDKRGRDLVVQWMEDLGLEVRIDRIGNVFGIRKGTTDEKPVVIGSHVDTVVRAGIYDGSLGVLAGLEVVEVLNENNHVTTRPVVVAFFTNEEGVRFQPDMMGSLVFAGGYPLQDALNSRATDDGTTLKENLERIGYYGSAPAGQFPIEVFIEFHVEQGPVLDAEGITIGVVKGAQGISWTEYRITGVQNHAGTTPMAYRKDAGYVAAEIIKYTRDLVMEMGENQVSTVGMVDLCPNLINVIAEHANIVVDLRNTDGKSLREAEQKVSGFAEKIARKEGVRIVKKALVRLDPVPFDEEIVQKLHTKAKSMGFSVKKMWSGAGHDAQLIARVFPAAMIFIPSKDGISHNAKEYSSPEDIEKGANLLLQVVLELARQA
ncbi:MAG: Zn-dependent hydrolase [Candidatus Odinarchaeota archaeon]